MSNQDLKKQKTYFKLYDWMIEKLELRDVPLLVYALIYSFSISGKKVYDGGLEYLTHRLSVSKTSVRRALEKLVNSGLIDKLDIYSPRTYKYCAYRATEQPLKRKGIEMGVSAPNDKFISIPTWMTPIRKYNAHALEVFAMIHSYTQNGISYSGNDVYIENRFKISKRTLQRTMKFLTSNGFLIDTSENVRRGHNRSYKAVDPYRFTEIIDRLERLKDGDYGDDFDEEYDMSEPAQDMSEPEADLTKLLGNIGITASSTPEEITSAILSYFNSGSMTDAAEPEPPYLGEHDTSGETYDDAANYIDDPNFFDDEDVVPDVENVEPELMTGYAEQCEHETDCIANNISEADFMRPSEIDNDLPEHNTAGAIINKNEQCPKDTRKENSTMCKDENSVYERSNELAALMNAVAENNKLLRSIIEHQDEDKKVYDLFDHVFERSRELNKLIKQFSERRCEEDDIDQLMDELPPGCILIPEEDLYDTDDDDEVDHYYDDEEEDDDYCDDDYDDEEIIGPDGEVIQPAKEQSNEA